MAHLAGPTLTITPAGAHDLPAVEALLAAHDLPLEGVRTLGPSLLVMRDATGDVVGAAGVEPLGAHGLLRSVVVASQAQGQGMGARLVAAAEQSAAASSITDLWLLTTSAAPFFARLGYHPADRNAAPPAVRATQEFTTLCPDSARLMQKSLHHESP